jgi:hypothetical protein
MRHAPFDMGALNTLGALTGQKTIKALCGKRVAFEDDAMTRRIECPACRAALAHRAADHVAMIADCEAAGVALRPETVAAIHREAAFIRGVLAQ